MVLPTPGSVPSVLRMHGPDIIKAARYRANLTQAELAERAGTTQTIVSRYESRRVQPTFAMVERLVAAAGLQMELELVTRVVPFWAGPMGAALGRHRAEIARKLLDAGAVEVEIAGDLAIGDDVPGATLLLLVRFEKPLDWTERTVLGVSVEMELGVPGVSVAIVDMDDIPPQRASEADGPRVPFDLRPGE